MAEGSSAQQNRTAASRPSGTLFAGTLAVALSCLCAAMPAQAAAQSISGYAQLESALTEGQDISVQVDLGRCTVADTGKPGPQLRGGTRIGTFLIPDNKYVAFTDVHPTLDAQNHPVTEYIRYQITPDGAVTVRTAFRSGSSDTATPRGVYNCAINQGIRLIPVNAR